MLAEREDARSGKADMRMRRLLDQKKEAAGEKLDRQKKRDAPEAEQSDAGWYPVRTSRRIVSVWTKIPVQRAGRAGESSVYLRLDTDAA